MFECHGSGTEEKGQRERGKNAFNLIISSTGTFASNPPSAAQTPEVLQGSGGRLRPAHPRIELRRPVRKTDPQVGFKIAQFRGWMGAAPAGDYGAGRRIGGSGDKYIAERSTSIKRWQRHARIPDTYRVAAACTSSSDRPTDRNSNELWTGEAVSCLGFNSISSSSARRSPVTR
ncbi:hypothetical protein GWI33_002887 [Rhynchophorus ferrugineus]|uniref:Uncharacterized protein n=1 Tax=Rhynchophorus ferrugineus TaxID=354439 RepID=A0A834MG60_RHYFE|nr:hypothetical protein GWI33_002887 [Rhynchophorus ferrugineus]